MTLLDIIICLVVWVVGVYLNIFAREQWKKFLKK